MTPEQRDDLWVNLRAQRFLTSAGGVWVVSPRRKSQRRLLSIFRRLWLAGVPPPDRVLLAFEGRSRALGFAWRRFRLWAPRAPREERWTYCENRLPSIDGDRAAVDWVIAQL